MKYGVCAWSVPGEFEEKMKFIAELGFDGVSLTYLGSVADDCLCIKEYRAWVQQILAKYNLELPTIGVNGLCKHGMSKVEDEKAVCQMLDEAVEIAAQMGVKTLQLPSFVRGNIQSEEELKQTIKCLQYVCKKALPHDILVGHESVLDVEDIQKVLAEVNSENLFVFYDGANTVRTRSVDPLRVLDEMYKHIWQLHIKDRHEDLKQPLYLGEGESKVKEICEILKKKQYDGWVILESEYTAFEEYKEILKKDYGIIKELLQK